MFGLYANNIDKTQKKLLKSINKNGVVVCNSPAGTGKSKTIATIVADFVMKNKKVLICTKSDTAANVMHEQLRMLGGDLFALRLGRDDSNIETALLISELVTNKYQYNNEDNNFVRRMLKSRINSKIKRNLKNKEKRQGLISYSKGLLKNQKDKDNFNMLDDFFSVFICTVYQISDVMPLIKNKFDLVVFDEASQLSIAECMPCIYRGKKLLVVGDDRQLRSLKFIDKKNNQGLMVKAGLTENEQNILDVTQNSLIDWAVYNADETVLLDTQYRMRRNLFEFNNKRFYGGAVNSAKNGGDVLICKCSGVETVGVNQAEIDLIIDYISKHDEGVAVCSPFRNQVKALKDELEINFSYAELQQKNVIVGTPEELQGQERSTLIISCVVDNNSKHQLYNHLNNENRFNVMISRGIDKLILCLSTTQPKGLLKEYVSYCLGVNNEQNI